MKRAWLLLLTLLISMTMSVTAFAGVWKTGEGANQNRWWYDNEDGTYVQNGWQWLDGNQDGIAECYYFDGNVPRLRMDTVLMRMAPGFRQAVWKPGLCKIRLQKMC